MSPPEKMKTLYQHWSKEPKTQTEITMKDKPNPTSPTETKKNRKDHEKHFESLKWLKKMKIILKMVSETEEKLGASFRQY